MIQFGRRRIRVSRTRVVEPVALIAALGAAACTASPAGANSFADTTPGVKTFTVPVNVHSLSIRATGGAGGDLIDSTGTTLVAGGQGALVTGTVSVSPGQKLQLTVATNGGKANVTTGSTGSGGTPNGGAGGYSAGGGGGVTRVLSCQGVLCSIAVIAAGGGGAGASGYTAGSPYPNIGGTGGAAGDKGGDGASDTTVVGGTGGGPGTSSAQGTGGSGLQAGDDGSGSSGGAGGNQNGNPAFGEGGGGGGGGVFGGGGGGSGHIGQDASFNQASAGGGGGGGGSSLPPPGGTTQAPAPHAAASVVLTWTAPPAPAISKLTRSPAAFVATSSGPSAIPANGGPGTRVDYTLNETASVKFIVLRAQSGRKVKGRCVKPTKTNRKAHKCTRLVPLPGSFTRSGNGGANSFRFTGRIAGQKLKPGKYRLVATPSSGGKTGRAASVPFRIVS